MKKTLNDAKELGKEFTSLNADWALDNLLCNYRKRTQIVSSTTFAKIVYYCAFKYQSPFDVVVTFFIKTITH